MTDAKTLVARLRARAFGPSIQHQVGDFTIATADMALKDEDCAEAADAIEELTAGIGAYLALLERSLDVGPHTNNPSREAKRINHLRTLLTKYGASNG